MTLLSDVVSTSRRVAETPSRNAKIAELAACLRRLAPTEIEIAVGYLSGETGVIGRQPRGEVTITSRLQRSQQFLEVELRRRCGGAVAPGIAFGRSGEGWIRLCLAATRDDLVAGLRRLPAPL